MKKNYLIVLTLLLMIPFSVFATENPKVLTLEATADGNKINFEGTTESEAHAVMCKLYNSKSEEIDKLSVAVDNSSFEGTFTTTETGDYKVACANYEGGLFKEANISIEEEPTYYTVSFNSTGGTEIEPVEVMEGQTVSKPTPDPTNGDKIFSGWYEDDTFLKEFDFNTEITKNTELFALWTEIEMVRVDFDTRCEEHIDSVEIPSGEKVERPTPDPTNGDKIFGGWYEDDTFLKEFDFNTEITKDIVLFALWTDPEIEEKEYNVNDESGNAVVFTEEEGHAYTLSIVDYLSFTKEEVIELAEIDEETYDTIFGAYNDATKDEGTLISMLDIVVTDEFNHDVTEGPITIKIKLTDEMKKYNTLKLIYVKDDFTIEEPILLEIDGDYAVGTLQHLSMYTVVGTNTTTPTSSNPKTVDNIYSWCALLMISILGLSLGSLSFKKVYKSNN